MNKIKIAQLLEDHPELRKRSEIYPQLQKMFFEEYNIWLEIDQIRKLYRAHRSFQELIPNDEVGVKKEKEWRKERGMQSAVEIIEELREDEVMVNGVKMKIKK